MLQVRKVIEHVYEKMIGQGSDAGSHSGSQTAANSSANSGAGSQHDKSETEKEEDILSMAEDKIELLCNDEVRSGGASNI